MKRNRNPKYAPEVLERKLSPSGFAGNPGVAPEYAAPAPATLQDNRPAPNPSSAAVADSTPTSNTVYYVTAGAVGDDATDPTTNDLTPDAGTSDPASSDPAVADPTDIAPTNIDPASNDDSDAAYAPDPEPDPDGDPDDPESPDDPGRPPFVPLPPPPIGPEAQAS
jgi:hypothetical protein